MLPRSGCSGVVCAGSGRGFQKLEHYRPTDRQTDAQKCDWNIDNGAFADGENHYCVCPRRDGSSDSVSAECNAVVITEIKLKQNKRKTVFCFSEIVLFQFCFSVFSLHVKQNAETKQKWAWLIWNDVIVCGNSFRICIFFDTRINMIMSLKQL